MSDDEKSFAVDFNGEVIDEFPQPYPYFRKELDARTMADAKRAVKDCRFPHYSAAQEDARAKHSEIARADAQGDWTSTR